MPRPRRCLGLGLQKSTRRCVQQCRYLRWVFNPPLLIQDTPPALPMLCDNLWLNAVLALVDPAKYVYHQLVFVF